MKAYPNSIAVSPEDVSLAYLIAKLNELQAKQEKLKAALEFFLTGAYEHLDS